MDPEPITPDRLNAHGSSDFGGLVGCVSSTSASSPLTMTPRSGDVARALFDALRDASCAVRADGEIIMVNAAWRAACQARGGSPERCGEGENYFAVNTRVPAGSADWIDAVSVSEGLRQVLAGDADTFEYRYPCDGPTQSHWFQVRVMGADFAGARGALVSHNEVSDFYLLEQRINHDATHDTLTGLPNRQGLATMVCGSRSIPTTAHGIAVALVSLDRFRTINDRFGHAFGDELLIQVSDRLVHAVRPADCVARYSGDEFVVVWSALSSRGVSRSLCDRMASALREPFTVDGTVVHLSASIGVAFAPTREARDGLITAAGAAMRDAKARGGNRVLEFNEAHRRRYLRTVAMQEELWAALEGQEFVLHYQPIFSLRELRPVGVEALVRWQHPRRGLVPPNDFIPVAEATGLIVRLGAWVLQQACRDAAAFTGSATGLDVAVNVSIHQLAEPDFAELVILALGMSGLPADRLILEVTESAVLQDELGVAACLNQLSDLGVRVAIDDFGTGYSSLLYLRRYPVSALKLDRTFVDGMRANPGDASICNSIVGLASSLGITSVAEGVETLEQARRLAQFGCDHAQGFLWSPAIEVGELSRVLDVCSATMR